MSAEHFKVDGTLIEAWASLKSFKPKTERDYERRSVRPDSVDEADGTEGVVATRTLWSIFAVKSAETIRIGRRPTPRPV
jgi:hypothetical protein